MSKNLKFFMREQKDEIITVKGPDTIVDEKGNSINLEIRILGAFEKQKIQDAYRTRSIALDKLGNPYINGDEIVYKTEKDTAKAIRHLIAEALVFPNLKDENLMKFYNCYDITEMPRLVFSKSTEYDYISRVVLSAIGIGASLSTDELIEEAKN